MYNNAKGGLAKYEQDYYDDDEDYFYPDPGTDISKFRLYMCRWIELGQVCKMGKKWRYAHKSSELRYFDDPVPKWAKECYNYTYGSTGLIKKSSAPKEDYAKAKPKPVLSKKPKVEEVFAFVKDGEDSVDEEKDPLDKVLAKKPSVSKSTSSTKAKKADIKVEVENVKLQQENNFPPLTTSANTPQKMAENESLVKSKNKINEVGALKETLAAQADVIASLRQNNEVLKLTAQDYKSKFDALSVENLKLRESSKKQDEEIDYYMKQIEQYKAKLKKKKDNTMTQLMQQLKGSDSALREVLGSTLLKLKVLFECPITMDTIQSPVILPSGITIDEKALQNLLNTNQKDPFDRSQVCKEKITNRFALDVQEIFDNLKRTCDTIPQSNKSVDAGTQASLSGLRLQDLVSLDSGVAKEILSLHHNFQEATQKFDNATKQKDIIAKEFDKVCKEKNEYNQKLEKVTKEKNDLTTKLHSLITDKYALIKEKSDFQSQIKDAREYKEQAEKKIADMKKEIQDLNTQLLSLELHKEETNDQINRQSSECYELRQYIKSYQFQVKKLEEEKEKLVSDLSKLKTQLDTKSKLPDSPTKQTTSIEISAMPMCEDKEVDTYTPELVSVEVQTEDTKVIPT